MDSPISNIDNENILSSYNFARKSDVSFCEEISLEQFELLNEKNLEIIHKKEKSVVYINKKFKLNDCALIFCNTYLVEELFQILENRSLDINNLKLITHQSDQKVDEKLFKKKPSIFSKWFGINIDYENENLVPIPLGISNIYSPKNLRYEDFKENYTNMKDILIYSNFQVNTNYFERTKVAKILRSKKYIKNDEPNCSLQEYAYNLAKSKFAICPQGNGIDTHRFWESLYLNTIPIAKKHKTFDTAKNLPVLFVESFDEVKEELCNNYLAKKNSQKINYKILDINYWITLIKADKFSIQNQIEVTLSTEEVIYIKKNLLKKLKKENFNKNLYTFLRKIHKKLFIFK